MPSPERVQINLSIKGWANQAFREFCEKEEVSLAEGFHKLAKFLQANNCTLSSTNPSPRDILTSDPKGLEQVLDKLLDKKLESLESRLSALESSSKTLENSTEGLEEQIGATTTETQQQQQQESIQVETQQLEAPPENSSHENALRQTKENFHEQTQADGNKEAKLRSWLNSLTYSADDVERLLRLKQDTLNRGHNLTIMLLCNQLDAFKGSKNVIYKHVSPHKTPPAKRKKATEHMLELFDKTFEVTRHSPQDIRLTFRQHPTLS